MLNGLDLFSGYGGISIALSEWIKPIAYCEIERHSQAILLSQMAEGKLPIAPIWDDVKTLGLGALGGSCDIDIIYGGFPCQDISVAGNGKGLAGKRSGLVFEIFRLIEEIQPSFVFLENVPAIRTRGGERVGKELASLGYDCRWDHLSAFDVGANHKRERWFLLAYTNNKRGKHQHGWWSGKEYRKDEAISGLYGKTQSLWDTNNKDDGSLGAFQKGQDSQSCGGSNAMADTNSVWQLQSQRSEQEIWRWPCNSSEKISRGATESSWWGAEPDVGRVANGTPFRLDRIKALGNGVVPLQAKTEFKRLMGLT